MEISVETALLNTIKGSSELTSLVPVDHITNVAPGKDAELPFLSLFIISGSSRAAMGYNNATVKRRDNRESWQVSVLACSKAQARAIVSILDRLFIPQVPAAGLVLVERTNDADAYETVPGRWHMPPRYQGEYTIVD